MKLTTQLIWNDHPFGSTAPGGFEITPDGKRFYLEVKGVQQFEGSLAACKRFAQTIADQRK